jgi:D-alanine-D-alanine ligase
MKRLRVLVLMHGDLVPPEEATGVPEDKYVPWKTEFDVLMGLEQLGHTVRRLGADSDLTPIRQAIEEFDPHIVFNLLESFHGIPSYDHYVTTYLELLQRPYTGCNPRGLLLSRDKALSRKILSYHRIPGPAFAVFPRERAVRRPTRVKFPLLVKSLTSDGSIGLAQASVVHTDEKLEERVQYLHASFDTDVIAEEYVLGREVYVPILGNRRLQTFPIMELDFGKLAEGAEPIATSKVKWDWKYQERHGIDLKRAKLTKEVEKRLVRIAKRVYRALSLSGYARIDFRLNEEGHGFVIEANPNADLGFGEELHEAVEAGGLTYTKLLQRILNLGLGYQAEWRQVQG